MKLERILVPTDLSPGAYAASELAAELAKSLGATITLLNCFELPPLVDPSVVVVKAGEPVLLRARLEKEARGELSRKARELHQRYGVEVNTIVEEGRADHLIVEKADQFDMVVMGTHGRKGFSHMLIGSVAEIVIRRCKVPVLTVRQP